MPSHWIISKSSVRYVALTAIVVGCSGSSDATDAPGQGVSYGGYAGYGGLPPNQLPPGAGAPQQQIPPPGPLCGNGIIDQGEQCEGGTTMTCDQATMGSRPVGNVACTNCYIDTNGCTAQWVPPGGGGAPGGGAPPVGGTPVGGSTPVGGTFGGGGSPPPPPVGGAAGTPPPTPTGTAAPPGNMDPVIPAVTGDCPQFVNSTITFMGLGGIQIVAGTKPAGPTAPMVFYWHGTGSTSGEFGFMAAAVQQGVVSEGGVLVSFQNTTGGDLLSGTSIFGAGDFKLADQLLACAVRDHNIDPRQIYTMGCSAGGLFSAAMAAERSSYIAAAAPNSGGWVAPVPWENNHTPALMTVHGAPGSDVVVVDFSNTSTTADTAFKGRGGFVIDCNTGGGHCGGGGLAGDAWKFMKAHPFGVSPEPWSGGLPAGFSSQCQIK